jgi:hypothetical protein
VLRQPPQKSHESGDERQMQSVPFGRILHPR